MLGLRVETAAGWVDGILDNFDAFLIDHAACERKASANAMHFVVRYADKAPLVEPMIALAREELEHFHQVYQLIQARGLQLGSDHKDPYVGAMLTPARKSGGERLLDRLLIFGIVEARGCERFGIVAEHLPPGELKTFYTGLAQAEARHHGLFIRIAKQLFDEEEVMARQDLFLDHEAAVIAELPFRASLH